jgi:hypothetical protein
MNIKIKKLNGKWAVVDHPLRDLGRERILAFHPTRAEARIDVATIKQAERKMIRALKESAKAFGWRGGQ